MGVPETGGGADEPDDPVPDGADPDDPDPVDPGWPGVPDFWHHDGQATERTSSPMMQ